MATGSGGTAPPSSSTLREMSSGCVREVCDGFEVGILLLGGVPLFFWAAITAGKPINIPNASTIHKREELTPIRTSKLSDAWAAYRARGFVQWNGIPFLARIRKFLWVEADTKVPNPLRLHPFGNRSGYRTSAIT